MHRRPPSGMLANMWEFPMALAEMRERARSGWKRSFRDMPEKTVGADSCIHAPHLAYASL